MSGNTETQKTEREQGLEFALQLMGANSEGLAKTTNTLIDNLMAERDELQAEIKAIRANVENLFAGPYTPSPRSVLRALWPSEEIVNQYKKDWQS